MSEQINNQQTIHLSSEQRLSVLIDILLEIALDEEASNE